MTAPDSENQIITIELDGITSEAEALRKRLASIGARIRERDKALENISRAVEGAGGLGGDEFKAFLKKPYTTLPFKEHEILVIVPKFTNFQVGWLHKETETYNIFRLSQFAAWLGEVPRDLLDLIEAKRDITGTVIDGNLVFPQEDLAIIKERLGKHLEKFEDGLAHIKKGHEFDLIAEMISNGCLPFQSNPIDEADLRPGQATFELYPYQVPAYELFMKTGAIGVFFPTGAGKSLIALKCADVLKGQKLIVVPTVTLKEQWEEYLRKYLPGSFHEFTIVTYNAQATLKTGPYVLAIYDECNRLPANTFAKLALVRTKYRIGLSATPFREDGRENYIFALTGYPIGINWQKYMQETGRAYHPVYLHVVKRPEEKLKVLKRLLDPEQKTLIFCDSIEIGQEISKKFKIPFIWGDTKMRLKTIAQNRVIVASRVADLGVSIKDLQRIIELDFLYGSRSQELQRTGRLMHTELVGEVRHDIIMTHQEIEQYGKRLWALREKGFKIIMGDPP